MLIMGLILRSEASLATVAFVLLGLASVYWVCKCAYNLFLHPLSGFPGSKLAAIGSEYEFYYDVIKDGIYLWKIRDMHRKYGKTIAIFFQYFVTPVKQLTRCSKGR
jgi:hypothetical protein